MQKINPTKKTNKILGKKPLTKVKKVSFLFIRKLLFSTKHRESGHRKPLTFLKSLNGAIINK